MNHFSSNHPIISQYLLYFNGIILQSHFLIFQLSKNLISKVSNLMIDEVHLEHFAMINLLFQRILPSFRLLRNLMHSLDHIMLFRNHSHYLWEFDPYFYLSIFQTLNVFNLTLILCFMDTCFSVVILKCYGNNHFHFECFIYFVYLIT